MGGIPVWLCIVIAVLAAGLAGAAAFFLGINYRKSKAEAAIGSAEEEAKRIVGDAIKTAEARKKEIILEGKAGAGRSSTRSAGTFRRRRAWRRSWRP